MRLGRGVDKIGRAGPGLAHAHVERSVLLEGKPPVGLVDLHR
jgi:hypothetical protein